MHDEYDPCRRRRRVAVRFLWGPVSTPTGSVLMIGQLGFGIVHPERRPDLVLTTIETANFYIEPIAIRSLR
jgi:hypothetical protein